MSAWNPEANDLFLKVVEIPSLDERRVFLAGACTNAALRAEVEALLAASDQAGSFLESPFPVLAVTVDEPITERPGTVIGPYKLLEQIGEGGFGVVFMAEQTQPVRRKVALKVIKPGMDTRQVIARFEAERQALALMEHPNIARVLDAGSTEASVEPSGRREQPEPRRADSSTFARGRPYFVMELVRGTSMTDYCDQHNLPVRERLELFVDVCRAVQHAHQKGIIHRDIKPSNVLVTLHDGRPVVKVIDFGIAKAMGQQLTEKTLFTNFAQLIGTPLYMSPEQAEMSGLDVDTRSDIYSLGVLLYELLTGTTPFDKERLKQAGFDEIRRIIREEEPPKPSTRMSTVGQAATTASEKRQSDPRKLSRLFRGELDWMVMKALEKDRNRRYETASAFAADVGRYLKDEAVQACPPSAWYRFRKLVRRNKRLVGTAVVVLLALLFVLGSIGWIARDMAVRQTVLEREVTRALQETADLYQRDKLPEAMAETKRAEALLASDSGNEELRERVRQWRTDLDLVARLEEIRLERAAVKDEDWDRASADRAYRDEFRQYGLDIDALDPEEAARRIRSSVVKDRLVAALDDWLVCKGRAGLRLVAVSRRAASGEWRERFRQAYEHNGNNALKNLARDMEVLAQPPATANLLAAVLVEIGEIPLAVELLRQVQHQHPGDFWINYDLAHYLGEMKPTDLGEAVGFSRAALALRPENSSAHVQLGLLLHKQGKLEEAINACHKAIELKPDHAYAHNNLGVVLYDQRKLDQAIAEYRKAIELKPDYAVAHNNLGNALHDGSKSEEAIIEYHKSIELKSDNADAYYNLGNALRDQGKVDQAIVEYGKAISLKPDFAYAHQNLGIVLSGHKHDYDGAIAAFLEVIRLKPDFVHFAHYNLGLALYRKGNVEEAIAEFQTAIRIQPKEALLHNSLGTVLMQQGKLDQAITAYRRALEAQPDCGAALFNLACILANGPDPKLRDPSQAIELAKKGINLEGHAGWWQILGWAHYRAGAWRDSIAALEKSIESNKAGADADQLLFLAMAHWQLGHKEEARQWYDRAVSWIEKNQEAIAKEDRIGAPIQSFRAEAAALLGLQDEK
jgi:serine/threonine protein kinase/Flp pilus assembly protein TadD